MNTTTPMGLKKMTDAARPLKFIHLKELSLGCFRIVYHLNDGFVIENLTQIRMQEQLLFQKFDSRNHQLNLMMVDTIFPVMLAELASLVLIDGPITLKTYVGSGKSAYGEYLVGHKMQQFVHCLLYSKIGQDSPFSGEMEYERLYYRRKSKEEIEYYSIYDRRELEDHVYANAIVEIVSESSVVSVREAILVLKIYMS